MPTTYKASDFLTHYIMSKESCARWDVGRNCYMPYPDGGGLSTIGYGHLITHAETEMGRFKIGLSANGAVQLLRADLQKRVDLVKSLNIPGLTQGQFDALVDFCWNCGFELLNAALHDGVANFPKHCIRYVHDAKGNVEPGLVTRRQDEIDWWYRTTVDPS